MVVSLALILLSLNAFAVPIDVAPAAQTVDLGDPVTIDVIVTPGPGEYIGGLL